MTKMLSPSFMALALTALVSGTSSAAPVTFFGENQAPLLAVSGAPVTARASFLSNLTGVGSQEFESQAFGTTSPLAISFAGSAGALTAQLTGTGQIENRPGIGTFNTSPGGSKWWESFGAFGITFATPIAAFGFYGTDIGDVNGQLTLNLIDTNDAVTSVPVPHTVNGASGALLFFGFIDAAKSYKAVNFIYTGSGTDAFGFDSFVIGDRGQVCTANCGGGGGGTAPEPGSLALAGLSLAALAAASRRRARA